MKPSISISILLLSIQAQAGLDVSLWSYRYLAKASNVLLVASDQFLGNQKVICGIKGQNISMLSQSLKSLVDDKIQSLNPKQLDAIRSQAGSCQEECSCDLIAYALSPRSTTADHEAIKTLERVSKSLSPADRLKCAQNFTGFCQSQLLKRISQ